MHPPIPLRSIVLLLSLCVAGAVAAQGDDKESSPPEPKPAASERQIEVWTLHGNATANRHNLNEETGAQLVEIYVAARLKHAEDVASIRQQWREIREQMLREGSIGGGFFDNRERERSLALAAERGRNNLAQALIELLERPMAERIYPGLAGFNPKIDGMIARISEFELSEASAFKGIEAVEKYFADTAKAAQLVRTDRAAWTRALVAAQGELLEAMKELLDEEQFERFSRLVRRGRER